MPNIYDQFDAEKTDSNVYDQFDSLTPPKKEEPQSNWRRASDIGLSGVKGAIGVTEGIVGLADLVSGGSAGKALEEVGFRPREAKAFLDEYLSEDQKKANQAVQNAEGFFDTAKAAIQNPSVILNTAVESVPSMLLGGAIARGIGVVGKVAPWLAGGIGEGVVSAGTSAENIRQQTEDGLITGKQAVNAGLSGAGTALFGAVGGRIAQKLGISDVDTMLAGGASGVTSKGVARRIIEGGISEGAFEELPQSLQDQIWQNAALDKPLLEGVPEAGAMGLVTGASMGAVGAGLSSRPKAPVIEPEKETAPLAITSNPDPLISFPDGSVGRRADVEAYINELPENERIPARAKLLGYGQQTIEDIEKAGNIDDAIKAFEGSVSSYPDADANDILAKAAEEGGVSELDRPSGAILTPEEIQAQERIADTLFATNKQSSNQGLILPTEAVQSSQVIAPVQSLLDAQLDAIRKRDAGILLTSEEAALARLPLDNGAQSNIIKADGNLSNRTLGAQERLAIADADAQAQRNIALTPVSRRNLAQAESQTSPALIGQENIGLATVATPSPQTPQATQSAPLEQAQSAAIQDIGSGSSASLAAPENANSTPSNQTLPKVSKTRQASIDGLASLPTKELRAIAENHKRLYMRTAAADLLQDRDQKTRQKRSGAMKKVYAKTKRIDPDRDSMAQAIAKLGGINSDTARSRLRLAPEELSVRGQGVLRVFNSNGRSMDAMGEALAELGYVQRDENGKHDTRDFEDKLSEVAGGSDVYTPQGIVLRAEQEQNAAMQEIGADSQEDYFLAESHADAFEELDDDILFDLNDSRLVDATSLSEEQIDELFRIKTKSSRLSEEVNARNEGKSSQGIGSPSEGFLQSESIDEAKARLAKAEQDTKLAELELKRLDEEAKTAKIQREINARQDSSSENFKLGQSAEDSLSGQESLLVRGPEKVSEKAPVKSSELSIGITPNSAEKISVQDGKIYIGEYPAQDYETGEDVSVSNGASNEQIKAALEKANAIGRRQKIFGLKKSEAPEGSTATARLDTSSSSQNQSKSKINQISDFGEKIGGARKEVWASFKDGLNAVSDDEIAAQPLSKVWPAPDYQKMIDDGMAADKVASVRSLRDEVPTKPRSSWKVKRWADQVKSLRDFANEIMDGKITVEKLKEEMSKGPSSLQRLAGRIDLYQAVGHEKSLEGIGLQFHNFTLYKGRENVSLWVVEQKSAATAFTNWPIEIATGVTKQGAIDAFAEKYKSLNVEKSAKQTAFDIFSRQGKKAYFVGKKIGRNYATLAGPFGSVKEARDYRDANQDTLTKKLASFKDIPSERRSINRPRVGEDMRNGQDVTPQLFAETFGFRGVEFGNWVEQGRRQKDLNDAFDALMDMAAILNVPPSALSLNGELGLAFGARGGGGTNPAKAHYEPDNMVINLTKKSGSGSLGHEWWHALDNYFSRMRGKGDGMMTEALDVSLASRDSNFQNDPRVRREMVIAFGDVVRTVKQTALKARSAKLDAKRTKQYWTTGAEMSARAFESYLISKLQDQNASNDYLANIVDEETWKAAESLGFELDESYPYPTAGEVPAIRAAFDSFFQTIETREEAGRSIMYSVASLPGGLTAQEVSQSIEGLKSKWLGFTNINVVQSLSDLPNNLQSFFSSKNDILEGFYDAESNSVYLIADNLSSVERAAWVASHEVVGHGGLRMLQDKSINEALKVAGANRFINNLATAISGDRGNVDPYVAVEEAIAELAAAYETGDYKEIFDRYGVNIPASAMEGIRGSIARIIQAIRRFLSAAIGKPLSETSDADVMELIANLRSAVSEGGTNSQVGSRDILASKAKTGLAKTINIDGVDRPTTNSNGQPIAQTEEAIRNFYKWFGDSRVVDDQGRPLVVYHGTKSDITAFNSQRIGKGSTMFGDYETERHGIFVTPSSEIANDFAAQGLTIDGARVMPLYAKIQNPIDMTKGYTDTIFNAIETWGNLRDLNGYRIARNLGDNWGDWALFDKDGAQDPEFLIGMLKELGYDGANIYEPPVAGEGASGETYVAFLPEQIKSATGNAGTFDASNPSILYSKARDSWMSPPESKLDDIIYTMQDKQVDTKRVVEAVRKKIGEYEDRWDAYLQEELFHGRSAKQTKDFVNKELTPLLNDMKSRGISMEEFEEYLHMRHAEERNIQIAKVNPDMQDGGSGIKTAKARAYLNKLSDKQRKAYDALAKRIDAINANTRKLLIDAGLETPETIAAWGGAYKHYVPLNREETSVGIGQGFSVKGSASKRAMGSDKDVVDILANIAMQRERTIVRAEKNRVAKALYGLALQSPNKDFWLPVNPDNMGKNSVKELENMGLDAADAENLDKEPKQIYIDQRTGLVAERINPVLRSRDNVLAVRVNGKDRFLFFKEDDARAMRMVESLKNLDADQLGRLLSISGSITRYFAAINTQYNPVFGGINLIRDVQGALLNLSTTPIRGKQKQVFANTVSALRGIYIDVRDNRAGKESSSSWAKLYEEFQKEGGQTGFRNMFINSKARAQFD